MTAAGWTAITLAAWVSLAASAGAETQDEVYEIGTFAGAASICGVSDARLEAVFGKKLHELGVTADRDSPKLKRFREGMQDGIDLYKEENAARCPNAVAAFVKIEAANK